MNASSTCLATCVPVVTSPLSVVRPAQFSWPTHKRLRGEAEGPLLAAFCRRRAGVGGPIAAEALTDFKVVKRSLNV